MSDKEQVKQILNVIKEHNIVRINSGMVRDMFGNMLEMEEEGTHSFPITDPTLIRELDSLTPQQMESLVNSIEDGLLELELRDGEVKDE